MGERNFFLSTDLPGAGDPSWDEELVDAPSEDKHLDELSEEEEEVSPRVKLVLVEATSALGLISLGQNRDYLVYPRPTTCLETLYSACDTSLCNLVHDHGVEDGLYHFGDIGVLGVPHSHAEVKTWTENEVILREGPRTLGRGEGNLNTTPRLLDGGACPSTSESSLGMTEGYTLFPPGEETCASLSLSSIDNSHASMMSHLSFHKSNIRLFSVSLLMSLSLAASLITMA
ncbi:hypothetical protein Cgig2_012831 [Carnegiea gigantea]|uniref:Uncharacterized protein n=1 Tax=Carnegiea gigantea TaxID=171969 RepID=A0A9Q1K9R8_9CARY|nr:hypothetical protein Cgig2_012831 [Carnegiea gigantea]